MTGADVQKFFAHKALEIITKELAIILSCAKPALDERKIVSIAQTRAKEIENLLDCIQMVSLPRDILETVRFDPFHSFSYSLNGFRVLGYRLNQDDETKLKLLESNMTRWDQIALAEGTSTVSTLQQAAKFQRPHARLLSLFAQFPKEAESLVNLLRKESVSNNTQWASMLGVGQEVADDNEKVLLDGLRNTRTFFEPLQLHLKRAEPITLSQFERIINGLPITSDQILEDCRFALERADIIDRFLTNLYLNAEARALNVMRQLMGTAEYIYDSPHRYVAFLIAQIGINSVPSSHSHYNRIQGN